MLVKRSLTSSGENSERPRSQLPQYALWRLKQALEPDGVPHGAYLISEPPQSVSIARATTGLMWRLSKKASGRFGLSGQVRATARTCHEQRPPSRTTPETSSKGSMTTGLFESASGCGSSTSRALPRCCVTTQRPAR